ncbi:MAG: malto-oligosyltrehalose synthase [Geminicoccaceae bacterium]
MIAARRPRSTYRLQLREGVGFADAALLVPHLRRLGIGDLYLSPPFQAARGSTHGYDVVDPNRLDASLGGMPAFERLAAALRTHGMGLLLDIVPNHMGIGADNPWWWDVLKLGRDSRYARFFDIDFARDPDGKLVLPVLGAPLAEVLEQGQLALQDDPATGEPVLCYGEEAFPFTLSGALPRETPDARTLARLVEAQPYRLVHWQEGTERRNYRRFFNIDQLAGLRVEEEEVFEESHRLILDLVARDLIQGLRIDHVDGLTEPRAYLDRLQRRIAEVRPDAAPFYVVVEKILIGAERLPEDWPVSGTTGYEFMNEVLGLLVAPAGLRRLERKADELADADTSYPELLTSAKAEVLEGLFAGELDTLTGRAAELLQVKPAAARAALTELLLAFDVYRTYAGTDGWSEADAALLARTVKRAQAQAALRHRPVIAQLAAVLRAPPDENAHSLLLGFQQLSGPLMAKSAEDTAFYRYPRLLALNEVGGEPDAEGLAVADWHRRMAARQASWPDTLLATATHDTKRGEDARARLAVLSELPERWAGAVRRWQRLNAGLQQDGAEIHPVDELTIYQTLVGIWPAEVDLAALQPRLAGWLTKHLREGKERSDWHAPDQAYEEAAQAFLAALLDAERSGSFLADLERFVGALAPAGAVNGLSQLLLKLTAPGVPDVYQGTELWDLSLVDPDNRRPVDFAARAALLDAGTAPAELAGDWRDGRIKAALLARVLAVRNQAPELFAQGGYQPLALEGGQAEHALAFARVADARLAITLVPRRVAGLLADGLVPPPAAWGDTALLLPEAWQGLAWHDALTGRDLPAAARLPLAELLCHLPLSLLTSFPSSAPALPTPMKASAP